MEATAVLEARNIRKKYRNIIDTLRYHVATGRFSYVDRIMAAMAPSVVEETVREAVRAALSAASSPRVAKGNPIEYNREKNAWEPSPTPVDVEYVEEERLSRQAARGAIPTRARLHGKIVQVDGEWKILYTPPRIPSDEELAAFFDEIRRDLNVAKLVASLAMTVPAAEEWGGRS
jgi:CRISPR type I-A-associated protein Csa5